MTTFADPIAALLPTKRSLYYAGSWHEPGGGYVETFNPATGESLGTAAEANTADVDQAVAAAKAAFPAWAALNPLARAKMLKQAAALLREHSDELGLIDAANCGNPISEMASDAVYAAAGIEFFAGLATEIKGYTQPMGAGIVNMTVREPFGVCARIVAYNHPLLFSAMKFGAPLMAGNTVIIKPPPQAPLSAIRMMELLDGVFPPGVLNVITGGRESGEALTAHPDVPVITLVGSVPTARAIAKGAADRLKTVLFELGGKNAMIVCADADPKRAIAGAVKGMNFTWCGQSCGSTSRLFIHDSLYDEVLAGVIEGAQRYVPGIPTDPATTMGAIISKTQHEKILGLIKSGIDEGARVATGGKTPDDPKLANGFFIEPTVLADVHQTMRIAREEVFGPVLSVLKWSDEETMLADVNSVEYGLTGAVFTRDLATAHRIAARMQAGFVWVNNTASHFPGTPFGGYKQSGIGREESIDELYAFTQLKNINVTL